MKNLLVVAAVLLVAGCGGPTEPDWDQYDPTVKTRIEGLITDEDCDGLQTEFDNADSNDDPDLMGYLDDTMREIGCY